MFDLICSKDVRLPIQLQRAMAAEAEAAREARAKVSCLFFVLQLCAQYSYLPLSHCLISVCLCVYVCCLKANFQIRDDKMQQQKSTHLFPLK